MMEFGISTLPFYGARALDDMILGCQQAGFRNIEIMCEGILSDVAGISASQRKALVERARGEGLQYFVHAPIADINLMSLNAGIRREAQRQLIAAIQFTQDIQARRMVFHIGGKPYMGLYDFEEGYRCCIDALEPVVSAAEEAGIILLLENDPNKVGLGAITVESCRRILDPYQGRLGFLLDVGHAFMLGDSAIEEFCRTFAPILKGTHFSDNHRVRDEHLGLGCGEMDVGRTVEALKQIHYSGEIILEVKQASDVASSVACLRALI